MHPELSTQLGMNEISTTHYTVSDFPKIARSIYDRVSIIALMISFPFTYHQYFFGSSETCLWHAHVKNENGGEIKTSSSHDPSFPFTYRGVIHDYIPNSEIIFRRHNGHVLDDKIFQYNVDAKYYDSITKTWNIIPRNKNDDFLVTLVIGACESFA